MDLKDKKVLLVGLGILGGGISMARYFLTKGAKLTVTDLRSAEELKGSLASLSKDIKLTLSKHQSQDFEEADVVIFNPAVPSDSQWVTLAQKLKKEYYNDYTFFQKNIKFTNPNAKIVGITGTRGKTTVSTWTNYLLSGSVLGGNLPEANLLSVLEEKSSFFVLELSSFQLEYADANTPAPNIAILTNLYVDHLNRYKTLENYKNTKFKIFQNQTKNDFLLLNLDEPIAKEALKRKPNAKVLFVSLMRLPKDKEGACFDGDEIYLQFGKKLSLVGEAFNLAPHEKSNLLFAVLAAWLAGAKIKEISKKIQSLPGVKLRQEQVFKDDNYLVINDSAGTSPEATMAAIEKFKDKDLILICGGTDKELDFSGLAKKIADDVPFSRLYLLEGTATNELIAGFGKQKYPVPKAYRSLEEIIREIKSKYPKGTILFSPGAASFGLFKNEFDRGETFNKLVKKHFSLLG